MSGNNSRDNEYYYHQLNKQQQSIYYSILKGIQNLEEEFVIPQCTREELYDIFFRMRLDHPEIFWVPGFRYKYYRDSPNLIFVPEYLFKKNKIQEHQKAMNARVEKLVRPALKLSEWEKERYVHDFICENVCYDKLKKPYSHEIIGPLGQGVGVCEGIAKAVKILLDALGVWCVIALCGNNPEKGIKYRHTWNIVKIGGTYYHLDATFDNTLSKGYEPFEIRYDYFNLSDKQIFRDHEPLIAPAPNCGDGDHFYYKEEKLSFTKTEEVYKRCLQAAKKGKLLIFQWRGGYLTREVMGELLELMRKAGQEKNKTAKVGVNWPQAVISVSYQGAEVPESVLMEEANVSEQYGEN
ncbi:MAG: transglutaminase domain-containing protein [Muricoprocola sp.]